MQLGTGYGYVVFFFFLLPVPLFEYHIQTNALTEQQRNPVAIEFVERNQKCIRRQVFSQKIFFCYSAYIYVTPLRSPLPPKTDLLLQ